MSTYGYGRVEGDLAATRRRPGNLQPPPLLTTSLNNAHNLQHGLAFPNSQVPMSATSLSSPFSLNGASPLSASPHGAAGGGAAAATPVMAYNPQEWARRDHGDQQPRISPSHVRRDSEATVYAPRIHGPDEPVRSPPPPYSTNPIDASPAESNPSSQFSPAYLPSSASTCMSPACASAQTSPRGVPPPPPPPPPPPAPANAATQSTHNNAQLAPDGSWPSAPPASRRAASTGDMHRTQPSKSPLSLHSETPNQTRHGFALPPPPPGPPPRSMSLNRAEEVTHDGTAPRLAPRTRRPPARGTELDPVPPTPADWVDDATTQANDAGTYSSTQEYARGPEALHIRTQGLAGSQPGDNTNIPASATRARQDSLGGLIRSPAMRNRSASALRERRSASRAGRIQSPDVMSPAGAGIIGADDPLSHPLENLVLNSRASALADRRRSGRFTPKSGGSFQAIDGALAGQKSPPQSGRSFGRTPNSARSHVIEQIAEQEGDRDGAVEESTPQAGWRRAEGGGGVSQQSSPRVPPSPRPQHRVVTPRTGGSIGRPRSYVSQHSDKDGTPASAKMQPASPLSPRFSIDGDGENDLELVASHSEDLFIAQSVERHRFFIEQEAAAQSDAEKLQYFIQFILQESRLRRVRYGELFEEEGVQPEELVKGMFTLPATASRPMSRAISHSSRHASSRGRGGGGSGSADMRRGSASSSGTSFAESPLDRSRASTTATSDRPLKLDTTIVETVRRREGAFVPALSPIASMSAVTGRDEMESRGRPPSRWWEEGSTGSARALDVMGRSKRESKYMSALIEDEHVDYDRDRGNGASSSVPPPQYDGPRGEYPPEKGSLSSQNTPTFPPAASRRAPFENRPGVLDISHFTTLPPPYPRRHPAVNNNHPDLADTRAILRTLNDLQEAETAKSDFEHRSVDKRSRANSWSKHQRSMHEQEMEFRIAQRDLTRQQYDDANFALEDKIFSAKKKAIQDSFELYQAVVVTPIHAFLSTRIAIANNTIDTMTSRLLSRSSTPLPDQPQTEGDSQPELLERLTLLKWLFDAREGLHKAQFDIITKRNALYEELVLLPYCQPGTEENPALAKKKADATAFFARDLATREAAAADEALTRWTMLADTIHSATSAGVQALLSAFWDIAPQLQQLLQAIPSDDQQAGAAAVPQGKRPERAAAPVLARLEVLVPRHEVDETPAYWHHPLRYLYSVMGHAQASTRQFVDAQVSLWCLEQEIKEGLARAQVRDSGEPADAADARIATGVEELQDKVGVVEGQWDLGLGSEFHRVRAAVRRHLEATGGWDEELDEQVV